jgi:hypothetical protein
MSCSDLPGTPAGSAHIKVCFSFGRRGDIQIMVSHSRPQICLLDGTSMAHQWPILVKPVPFDSALNCVIRRFNWSWIGSCQSTLATYNRRSSSARDELHRFTVTAGPRGQGRAGRAGCASQEILDPAGPRCSPSASPCEGRSCRGLPANLQCVCVPRDAARAARRGRRRLSEAGAGGRGGEPSGAGAVCLRSQGARAPSDRNQRHRLQEEAECSGCADIWSGARC